MSIDRLSPSASMLELVRALSKRPGGTSKARAQNAAQETARSPSRLGVLRGRLAGLVKGVDPTDENALMRVRRPLFQEIVLWEFGSDFRQHPEFSPMLDTIERALTADPRASERLKQLIRDLRSQP